MATVARAEVTVTDVTDATNIVTWYRLTTSATSPEAPTTTDASATPAGWSASEPSYTSGATSYLHTCQQLVWGDGTCTWGDVQLSSAYEAAKSAQNAAAAASSAASSAQASAASNEERIGQVAGQVDSNYEAYEAFVDNNAGEIDSLASDIGAISEALEGEVSARSAHIRFATDDQGDPLIELGAEGSDMRVELTNEQLSFVENDEVVAYVNGQQLNISNARVTEGLNLGGFSWIPRSNGNLALKWVGE